METWQEILKRTPNCDPSNSMYLERAIEKAMLPTVNPLALKSIMRSIHATKGMTLEQVTQALQAFITQEKARCFRDSKLHHSATLEDSWIEESPHKPREYELSQMVDYTSPDETKKDQKRVRDALVCLESIHDEPLPGGKTFGQYLDAKFDNQQQRLLEHLVHSIKDISEDFEYEEVWQNIVLKGQSTSSQRIRGLAERAFSVGYKPMERIHEVWKKLRSDVKKMLAPYEEKFGGYRPGRFCRMLYHVQRLVVRYTYERYFYQQRHTWILDNSTNFKYLLGTRSSSKKRFDIKDMQWNHKQAPKPPQSIDRIHKLSTKTKEWDRLDPSEEAQKAITQTLVIAHETEEEKISREALCKRDTNPLTVEGIYQDMLTSYLSYYWRQETWPMREKDGETKWYERSEDWFQRRVKRWIWKILSKATDVPSFLQEFNRLSYRCLTEHDDHQPLMQHIKDLIRNYSVLSDKKEYAQLHLDLREQVENGLLIRYIQNTDWMTNKLIDLTPDQLQSMYIQNVDDDWTKEVHDLYNEADITPFMQKCAPVEDDNEDEPYPEEADFRTFKHQRPSTRLKDMPLFHEAEEAYKDDLTKLYRKGKIHTMKPETFHPRQTDHPEPHSSVTFAQLKRHFEPQMSHYTRNMAPRWDNDTTWGEVLDSLEPAYHLTYENMNEDQKHYCQERMQDMGKDYTKTPKRPWGIAMFPDHVTYDDIVKDTREDLTAFVASYYPDWPKTPKLTLHEVRAQY